MSIDDAKKDLYIENSDTESTNSLEFDVKANQEANQEEFNIEENEEPLVRCAYSSAYDKNGYLVLKPLNKSTSNVEKMDRVWQCFTSSLLEVKKLGKTPHFVYGKDGMSIWKREKDNNDMKKEFAPRSNNGYYFADICRALDITGGGRSFVAMNSMDFQFIKKDDKSMLQLIANLYTRAIILGMDDRKSNNFVYKYEPKNENKGGEITLHDIDISRAHDNFNGMDFTITPLFSTLPFINENRDNYIDRKMPWLFASLNKEVFDELTKEIKERIGKTIPTKDDIDKIVRRTCRKLIRKTDGKQTLLPSKIKEILRAWINYSNKIQSFISFYKGKIYTLERLSTTSEEQHDFNEKMLSIYDSITNAMNKTTKVLSNYLNNEQKINDILQKEAADALNEYKLEKKRKEINDAINYRLRKQKKLFWDRKGEGCKDGKLLNTRFFLKENAEYIREINNLYDEMCEQGNQNDIGALNKLLNLAKKRLLSPNSRNTVANNNLLEVSNYISNGFPLLY